MISKAHDFSLNLNAQKELYVGVMYLILLPKIKLHNSQKPPPINWEFRQVKLSQLLGVLLQEYQQIPQTIGFIQNNVYLNPEIIAKCQKIQMLLGAIVGCAMIESKPTKKLLFDIIQEAFPLSLNLFTLYANQISILSTILDFLALGLETFGKLIGAEFISRLLNTFLSFFQGSQLKLILQNAETAPIVGKFLRMLIILVQEPTSTFEGFLPNIVSLCLNELHSNLADDSSEADLDVREEFYLLLVRILLCNPKQFLTGSEPSSLATGSQIINLFLQSLTQREIGLVKENIDSLKLLHEKQSLFSREIFKALRPDFLKTLIDLLISKNQSALEEELIGLFYSIVSLDFDYFYQQVKKNFFFQID